MAELIDILREEDPELWTAARLLRADVAAAARRLSPRQARYLVDDYYAQQHYRIQSHNQTLALEEAEEPNQLAGWMRDRYYQLERQLRGILDAYSLSQPPGQWARANVGVGPVLAAGLLAHLESDVPTVGHWWSFAGLNPAVRWQAGEKRPWNAKLKTLCVLPNQRVQTRRGAIPIADVRVGDQVLTHQGRFRRVTEVLQRHYEGDIFKLKAYGMASMGPWLTAEHPVLATVRPAYLYGPYAKEGRVQWRRGNTTRHANYERAQAIRAYVAQGHSQREAARQFGVAESRVSLYLHQNRCTVPLREVRWMPVESIKQGWDVFIPQLPADPRRCFLDLHRPGMLRRGGEVMAPGRWAGVPHPLAHRLPARVEIDEALAYVLGLYVAEGHVSGHQVGWSFHERETAYVEAVQSVLRDTFHLPSAVTHNQLNRCQQVMATAKPLALALNDMCGAGALAKRLPEAWLLHLSDTVLMRLIDGIFDGDGYRHHGARMLTTTSKTLAWQVRTALGRLGKTASLMAYPDGVFKVREQGSHGLGRRDGPGTWHAVTGTSCLAYSGLVYNLEVEEDESYVVEGIAVHNCWKLGQSFVKASGSEDCHYGHLYQARKLLEVERNEAGAFAEQAASQLATKRFDPNTDAAKAYRQGRLPPAHLQARAERWAVKIFLAHYHECVYVVRHGELPPLPYAIAILGHAHEVLPPYQEVIPGWAELRAAHRPQRGRYWRQGRRPRRAP